MCAYCHQGTWMFDDERVELVQEPFVEGMPEIIDLFVQKYRWDKQALEGWLCPALYIFFSKAPLELYCKAEVA